MILKGIDDKTNLTKIQKYGHDAEKQMAFYLKRAFQDNSDIVVINDLRIQMGDDFAQMDHLIIHRFGFTVVESKSVTSKISINEHGEWIRHYRSSSKGMPSPVNQAKRQIDLLQKFLTTNCEHLLRKILISKTTLADFKYDVLVAISDTGIIKRGKNTSIAEVCKADQITEKIEGLIDGYAKTNDKLFSLKMNSHFRESTIQRISDTLVKAHKSSARADEYQEPPELNNDEDLTKWAPKAPVDESDSSEEKKCSKCNSVNISILYGRYGYYFKCRDCDGNTAIKLKCKNDSCKVRIRKAKLKFYKECSTCETSEFYFENEKVENAL
ncbi:MAG: NERD domain-containing protein [Desulfobacter sp.]|nr:MAG: NERD domain-containing protein [Desulfobacter sp.]